MNKYEEKFKKVIASKVTSLQSRETAIKHLETSKNKNSSIPLTKKILMKWI